jgi:hypothetical protein
MNYVRVNGMTVARHRRWRYLVPPSHWLGPNSGTEKTSRRGRHCRPNEMRNPDVMSVCRSVMPFLYNYGGFDDFGTELQTFDPGRQ